MNRHSIIQPFNEQPGDEFRLNGFMFEHWRGETLVDSRDLRLTVQPTAESYRVGNSPIIHVFWGQRNSMEAATATLIGVNKSGDNYNFQWGDGSGTPKTLEQLETELGELQTVEMAQKIQRVMAFLRSNGGANMSSQNGVCCTLDYQANNPVSFSDA